MFGKDKEDTDQAGGGNNSSGSRKGDDQGGDAPSIISADMKVVGDLQSGGDVQVEGSVEGDIKSRTVTIGEKAHINGSIHAETVNIRGRITGKVNAAAVRIANTANVQGDISYKTLSIEEGAEMDGQVKRRDGGVKSDAANKPEGAAADATVSSIKSSLAGDDIKSSGVSPVASGMKPSGGKPLAS